MEGDVQPSQLTASLISSCCSLISSSICFWASRSIEYIGSAVEEPKGATPPMEAEGLAGNEGCAEKDIMCGCQGCGGGVGD